MDRKRLLRSPLVWIAVVLVLYLGYSYLVRRHPRLHAAADVGRAGPAQGRQRHRGDHRRQGAAAPARPWPPPSTASTKIYTQYPAEATRRDLQRRPGRQHLRRLQHHRHQRIRAVLAAHLPDPGRPDHPVPALDDEQRPGRRQQGAVLRQVQGQAADQGHAGHQVHRRRRRRRGRARSSTRSATSWPNPARYQALGAKIPKGVLLYGPPGTGKTLLARAVAGEAGVPFYSISGSDFVEMFVGVGASRVRDLFEQAKANAPAIIFVDEIDAVGRHRGAGMGGGHDEREQTLNQLLVEMDGFEAKGGIILIAATNRPDILDPALLRPGRFDRQIPVGQPDLKGRQAILAVHSKGKPFAPDVDFLPLAKRTVGMSGADLANVINEAALLTAREHGTVITNAALEESVDRVVGGPARKGKVISEKEKKITAYHEGGHALAAWAMPGLEPVYKVTILPRGRTGGHALVVPEDDKSLMTRSEMIARLVMAHGRPGRRGAGVRRADHRRVLRHRAGHQDRPGDGHRVRHVRQARRGQVRPRRRRTVPRPHLRQRPGVLDRGRQRDRRRGAGAHRGRAHRGVGGAQHLPRHPRLAGRRAAGEGDAGAPGPRGDLRRGREAARDHHLRRVRRPRLPSDRPPIKTPRRAGHRARRAVAADRSMPAPADEPVPIGAVHGLPGQSGYNTGPATRQASAGDRRPGPAQRPPQLDRRRAARHRWRRCQAGSRASAASRRPQLDRRRAAGPARPDAGLGAARHDRRPARTRGGNGRPAAAGPSGGRNRAPQRRPERLRPATGQPHGRTGSTAGPARRPPGRPRSAAPGPARSPSMPLAADRGTTGRDRPARRDRLGAVAGDGAGRFDTRPGRGRGPRAADRRRRGPGPGRAAEHARPGGPGVRRAVLRAAHRPGRRC